MAEMTAAQLELIKKQLSNLKERSPFYAKKFADVDISNVTTQ